MKNWQFKMELDPNHPDDVYIYFIKKTKTQKWTKKEEKIMAGLIKDLGFEKDDDEPNSYLMCADDESMVRAVLTGKGMTEIVSEKFDWISLLDKMKPKEKEKSTDECSECSGGT
jgi:hypothetical protein